MTPYGYEIGEHMRALIAAERAGEMLPGDETYTPDYDELEGL